uniref:Uncharacterized protein n=1 Tax=Ditylenchus dipsaci TaxID=166011 RepID=A0A915DEY1_9BILA
MELAQLRMQVSKDNSTFGPRMKSPENEEIIKLKKTINSKEERISQLEDSFLEIQKRYNDELQRNDPHFHRESDALHTKIRSLEQEKAEKERRIQELLTRRVEYMDNGPMNVVHLTTGNSALSTPYPYIPDVNTSPYSSLRQRSSADLLPTSARAAYLHDSTMARMEELKRRIADRRPSPSSKSRLSKEDSSSNSSLAIGESHSRTSSGPTNYLHQAVDHHHQPDAQISSPMNSSRGSSSRMPAHMPEQFTQYIESLPVATRRRLAGSEKLWSSTYFHVFFIPFLYCKQRTSDTGPGSMRIDVGEMGGYSQKPPPGATNDQDQTVISARQSAGGTTTVVEINKEHLVVGERSRRSSLGNYGEK